MSTTLVDGDAEDLAGRCSTEVRDVEIAVRAECHTGRKGKSGGYIFDIADAVKAYNLPDKWWDRKAGSVLEFERVEEAIRAEVDGNDYGGAEHWQIWSLLAFDPEAADHLAHFSHAIMHQPGPINPALRELIAAYTSSLNN